MWIDTDSVQALASIRTITVGPGVSPDRLSNCLGSSRAIPPVGTYTQPRKNIHVLYDALKAIGPTVSVHTPCFGPSNPNHAQQDQGRPDQLASAHRLIQQE